MTGKKLNVETFFTLGKDITFLNRRKTMLDKRVLDECELELMKKTKIQLIDQFSSIVNHLKKDLEKQAEFLRVKARKLKEAGDELSCSDNLLKFARKKEEKVLLSLDSFMAIKFPGLSLEHDAISDVSGIQVKPLETPSEELLMLRHLYSLLKIERTEPIGLRTHRY